MSSDSGWSSGEGGMSASGLSSCGGAQTPVSSEGLLDISLYTSVGPGRVMEGEELVHSHPDVGLSE